ncbi:hypothetical protein [Spirosoma validum]|uniref:Uncharacterized protein n=1 Tax=Spirosoma validum TaxID=2771355 RepID=A0A927B017_9BACT|nr:hypothetical protein [Spirosoma validum]MBD2752792.1 hypothetical protein [Spirosoma validum]
MRTFSKHVWVALLGTAIISSCSRPVAYFQPQAREQFKSTPVEAVAVATPAQPVEAAPVATPAPALVATPAEQVAQAKQAISQVEAYVRNDSKLASNKKLTKRMSRVSELLTTANPQAMSATKTAGAQKTTLMQRFMLKKIDKQIKNHLSPEKPMAKSLLTIGLIIGIIGLILLILNAAAPLGLIALIVGLALILVDLIR